MPTRNATSRRRSTAARVPDQVVAAVLGQPWLISKPGIELVLAVVSRGEITPQAIESMSGRELEAARDVTVRDGVALIPVSGPLIARATYFDDLCGGATSYQQLAKDLTTAVQSAEVRAIVLRIASPGGQVHGCSEIAQLIRGVRGAKPIVAFVEGDACSAAYWLASACDEIVAADTAVLGCLGAQVAYMDDTQWLAKNGLKEVVITSSQTPEKNRAPVDDEGMAQWQRMVDAMAGVFLEAVALNRGVARSDVDARFGQGAVLVGSEAVAAGLADRLGTYESLHAELASGAYRSPRSTPALAGSTRSEESVMPPSKIGRAAAKASAKTSAKPKATAKHAANAEPPKDEETPDPSAETEEEIDEEEETPDPAAEGEETDDEDDEEEAPAPSAVRKAVTAERARITGILGLASKAPLAGLMPFIENGSTKEEAAHALLTGAAKGLRSTALTNLASDEAGIAGKGGLSTTSPASTSSGNPIVDAMRATNPRSLVTSAHGVRMSAGR